MVIGALLLSLDPPGVLLRKKVKSILMMLSDIQSIYEAESFKWFVFPNEFKKGVPRYYLLAAM